MGSRPPFLRPETWDLRRMLAATIVLFAIPVLGQEAVTPAYTERQADLSRLQAKIGALKAKLAESEKKAATLAEELPRLELKLEIATREGELVAATREEFARRLAAVSRDRA
ncbi:MAG: hypothetical protein WAU32_17820, partial [Thermoanaerobaculia bacterium]